MDYKISIIIPVYNVEKYIREALQSVVKQTIGLENIQVVMVNDCSSDKSGLIMDEYADKYNNFEAIHLPERSGAAGKPRNIGIEKATADYIMFLDPDDYYEETACKLLYDRIVEDNSDVVVGKYRYHSLKKEQVGLWLTDGTREIHNIEDKPEVLGLPPAVWTKIFKTSFIKGNRIVFPEKIVAQDMVFSVHCYLLSKQTSFLNEIVCNYHVRDEDDKSISNTLTARYFAGMNEAYRQTYDLLVGYRKAHLFQYIMTDKVEYIINQLILSQELSNEELTGILHTMHWFFELAAQYQLELKESWYQLLFERVLDKDYKQFVETGKVIAGFRIYIMEIDKGKAWLEQQVSNYQGESERFLLDMNELRNYIDELNTGKSWMEQQVTNHQGEVERLQGQVERLQAEVNHYQTELKNLIREREDWNDRSAELLLEIDNMNTKNDELSKKMEQMSSISGWIKHKRGNL